MKKNVKFLYGRFDSKDHPSQKHWCTVPSMSEIDPDSGFWWFSCDPETPDRLKKGLVPKAVGHAKINPYTNQPTDDEIVCALEEQGYSEEYQIIEVPIMRVIELYQKSFPSLLPESLKLQDRQG